VIIKLEIQCEEKDEPFPGALSLTPEIVVSRLRDILADVTRSDEIIAWRVTDVRPTA
jgi:hypothetical protein